MDWVTVDYTHENMVNPLSANITKWWNTLKQFVVFDHFVGLALKGLKLASLMILNAWGLGNISFSFATPKKVIGFASFF